MRILTYNIWDGGEGRLGEIAAVIAAASPDAVALQEVTRESVGQLGDALRMETVFGDSNSIFGLHVAWLSRLPVRTSSNHRLPELSKTLLEIEVEGVRLFATHLASRHEEPERPRAGEVAAILAILGEVETPHLLAGDLNSLAEDDPVGAPPAETVPRGEAVRGTPRPILRAFGEAGYVDCFRRLHPEGAGFTYQAWTPWLRLDYVLASPELDPGLRACEVVARPPAEHASDHLPVLAEFA